MKLAAIRIPGDSRFLIVPQDEDDMGQHIAFGIDSTLDTLCLMYNHRDFMLWPLDINKPEEVRRIYLNEI